MPQRRFRAREPWKTDGTCQGLSEPSYMNHSLNETKNRDGVGTVQGGGKGSRATAASAPITVPIKMPHPCSSPPFSWDPLSTLCVSTITLYPLKIVLVNFIFSKNKKQAENLQESTGYEGSCLELRWWRKDNGCSLKAREFLTQPELQSKSTLTLH